MAYEYDFRSAKPAGDHLGDGLHCKQTRRRTCITCRMDPMTGSLYCKRCDGIVNRHRSVAVDRDASLARQTERLAISTANTAAAATNTAAAVTRAAVSAPLAITTAAANTLSDAARDTERFVERTVMAEEDQAKAIFKYIRDEHSYDDEEEVARITNEIMQPTNYADRMEMLAMALKDVIVKPVEAVLAPIIGSNAKASGAQVDCSLAAPPTPAQPASACAASEPHSGARAGTNDSSCGDCLMCVIKRSVAEATPHAGAKAAPEPVRAAAPAMDDDAEARFRKRWNIPTHDARREAYARHAAASRTPSARPATTSRSIVEKYKRDVPRASAARERLSGTGFSYRCHNCSSTVFETSECKSCGVKVPSVYVEDAINAARPTSGAQFGESVLDGIASLNLAFGL